MLPDWLPGVHPLVVHFPIALFVVGIAVDVLSQFRKFERLAGVATLLYVLAAAGAVAAFFSGRRLANALEIPPHVLPDLNAHADWGLRTVWLVGLYGLVRLATWFARERIHKLLSIGVSAIGLVGLYFIVETAEHGGLLVFKHGLGIQVAEQPAPILAPPDSADVFDRYSDGSWSWQPGQGLERFVDELDVMPAGASSPTFSFATDEAKGVVLQIETQQPALLVVGDSAASVQLDLVVNNEAFAGFVGLAHNVVSDQSFYYVRVSSEGEVELGSLSAGESRRLDAGRAAPGGWHELRAVSAGTHFRGYVDGELVVHGHGDAPLPGSVGIHLDGSGVVRVAGLRVTPIE